MSSPADPQEREADEVADRVMRMPEPGLRPWVAPLVQRACAMCEGEDKTVETKRAPSAKDQGTSERDAEAAVRAAGRGGEPLSRATRDFFEPRFGRDFSRVRVHADSAAAAVARSVHARAYTVGSDIVFGAGEYAPGSTSGRHLLAHELSHVVQQRGGSARVQRAPSPAPATGAPAPTAATPGAPLSFEFNAFIPGALGSSFESFDHPTDLKNQASFDADLKAIKGTWLKEPGSFSALGTGPWYFATDNRGFGGGSHRLGFAGSVSPGSLGSLAGKGTVFTHTTSGSEHVRWSHTGYVSSKGETGTVEGPFGKSAPVKSSETIEDRAGDASVITTKAAASYPFKAAGPDIDIKVTLDMKRTSAGKTDLTFEIEHNKFPYYELLIDGRVVWPYTSSYTGPGVYNLNSSETFKSGTWTF